MGKAILAVVVGFVAWSILWLGGNLGLVAAFPGSINEQGQMTGTGHAVSAIVLSVLCSLVGGGACRRIAGAGRSPFFLAGLLLAVGMAVEIGGWDLAPAWYHLVFLVLIVPSTLAGAAMIGAGRLG